MGYCDANWAGDRVDMRSTTGYCTFIGGNLVTWKSKKQKVVSCSSAEEEYRAMRKLTSELIWIINLLRDLGIETTTPITMHCDNQAAIHIASNSVFHERTKHIEVDCHKLRQAVEKLLPCYTRSEDQLADIFTKGASTKACESIHPRLGLIYRLVQIMILFFMNHLLFFLSVFLSHWVLHTKVLMRDVFMTFQVWPFLMLKLEGEY